MHINGQYTACIEDYQLSIKDWRQDWRQNGEGRSGW
jgi:hypothetical protein